MNVTILNPDQNFLITHDITEKKGVGGGKVSLLKLSQALSRYAKVDLVCNCEPYSNEHLEFTPFSNYVPNDTDFLIVTTSSLMDISKLQFPKCLVKCLWIHGVSPIVGIEKFDFDAFVTVSYFLKHYWQHNFALVQDKTNCIHLGIEKDIPPPIENKILYSIVYASHPVKGLNNVVELVRKLRNIGHPFELYVYGGYELWGEERNIELNEDFVIVRGNVPESKLNEDMNHYSFGVLINPHGREGFGLGNLGYLKMGVIPLLSNVGAISEVVRDGHNGFLLNGTIDQQIEQATRIIGNLVKNKELLAQIRNNIANSPLRTWNDVAVDFINLYNAIKIKSNSSINNQH